MELGLQGKAVLVTGGSKGIGKETALQFAKEGANVAIVARGEEGLNAAVEELTHSAEVDVVGILADLASLADIKAAVKTAADKLGQLDVLVNNAGGAAVGGVLSVSDEAWEYEIQLKLLGYIRTAREAAVHLKKSDAGVIVNVVGASGKDPRPIASVPAF